MPVGSSRMLVTGFGRLFGLVFIALAGGKAYAVCLPDNFTFHASGTSTYINESLNFWITPVAPNTTYTWRLGDVDVGTGPEITLAFPEAGSFRVTVEARLAGCINMSSRSRDILVTKYPGTVVFDSLAFDYDGAVKVVVARIEEEPETICDVVPSSIGPAAGDYTVNADCDGSQYVASATGTATITKAVGTVEFDQLTFAYSGSTHSVTASLVEEAEAGCDVPESPIGPDAGTYPVSASCEGTNHLASGSGTAVIDKAQQTLLTAHATPSNLISGESSTLSTQGGSGTGAVSYVITKGAGSCELESNTLAAGRAGSCTVRATKAADTNHLEALAIVQVEVSPKADLQLAKDINRSTARVGDSVVYSIVASNAGPDDATSAKLTDIPPAGLLQVEWACIEEASSVPCPLDGSGEGAIDITFDLPAGGWLRFDLAGVVDGKPGDVIINTASVSVPPLFADPGSPNSDSASVEVVPLRVFGDGFDRLHP